MRKYSKITILIILIAALAIGALGFASIETVYAQPSNSLSGTLGGLSKSNCDGKELQEFSLSATYSVVKSDSVYKIKILLPEAQHVGLKGIANTTSWGKTLTFNFEGSEKSEKIDGLSGTGGIAAEFDLASPTYNRTYSMSMTVGGRHGYIGHGTHYWSMSVSGSFVWSKDAPTLSFTNVSSGGSTSSNVAVSSATADAVVEHKYNFSLVDTVASSWYSKVVSAEGRHDFIITNNDDSAGKSNSYYFIVDKTAPMGTLSGVASGGYTNRNVSFSWNDAAYNEATVTATLDGNKYLKGTAITAEGRHEIVILDSAGNSTRYIFTIDKTAPTGTLKGVTNGGKTASNVSFSWSEVNVTATLNGNAYNSGATISNSGNHTIVIIDLAGNSNTYTFMIDNTRPYINNLDEIKGQFGLDAAVGKKLSAGQTGNANIDIGWALPGIEFNLAEEWTGLRVNVVESLFIYNTHIGSYIQQSTTSYAAASRIKLSKPGQYTLVAIDDVGNELRISLKLGAEVQFMPSTFILKDGRYILGQEIESQIIGYVSINNNSGIMINIDGENIPLKFISLDKLKELLSAKSEREKSARIIISSIYSGAEITYFDAYIGYDFADADIHNIDSLLFESGSGSYLGTAKPGVKFDYGALATELNETAILVQTLYAYDSRNVLYVKEEQSVAYISGLIISNLGYYILRITDGARVTEYTFKVMDEYKSANEFALKSEYFIAPEYNLVKLPMSFGTFNISHHENISDAYLGKYSAEKQYLFSASENTAQAFAFAAEFSVCVQKTATGYLYRAKNQGIQIAYNSIEQLNAKIREVIKEYISYKSMKMTDSQSIDYSNQIIMDESLKYNGNYQNVAAQIVNGVTYDNVLLINKSFVFKTNAGRDALSSLAKITLTNIESGAIYNLPNGTALQDVTTLNGLYKVEENCPGSNAILSYYVYIDNVAGAVDIISTKADGTVVEQTVTAADTIVLQVAEFNLKSVTDLIDNYCLVQITGYGFSNAIPIYKGELKNIRITTELGHKGAYTI